MHNRIGTYMLSVWEEAPDLSRGILPAEVVYIGETHTVHRSLTKRWSEFERVALGKAENHSGAIAFRENGLSLESTWLLAFPIPNGSDDAGIGALAQLFERELIWHYYDKYGILPNCNKK